MTKTVKSKLKKLESIIKKYRNAYIFFSGGVDSSFLLMFAVKTLGSKNVTALTATGNIYSNNELKSARKLTKKLKVKHIVKKRTDMNAWYFKKNPKDRCFYCKDAIFSLMVKKYKAKADVFFEATNYSDLSDYRPGLKAVKKNKVLSPLLLAKLTKNDIRSLSRAFKLSTWKNEPETCYATRFPYGIPITAKEIKRIQVSENYLKKLSFKNVRVRNFIKSARIEVDKSQVKKLFSKNVKHKVFCSLLRKGFKEVVFDKDGYKTGKLNRLLKIT